MENVRTGERLAMYQRGRPNKLFQSDWFLRRYSKNVGHEQVYAQERELFEMAESTEIGYRPKKQMIHLMCSPVTSNF